MQNLSADMMLQDHDSSTY